MNFQTAGIMNLSLLELGGQEPGDARNLTAAQVTTSNHEHQHNIRNC